MQDQQPNTNLDPTTQKRSVMPDTQEKSHPEPAQARDGSNLQDIPDAVDVNSPDDVDDTWQRAGGANPK